MVLKMILLHIILRNPNTMENYYKLVFSISIFLFISPPCGDSSLAIFFKSKRALSAPVLCFSYSIASITFYFLFFPIGRTSLVMVLTGLHGLYYAFASMYVESEM